ncbi:MAG TPA: hypothetical protein VLA88_00605 [Candidatus Saccharimonadales bacterium]|nr:hypothetical protein [Candidatus Saccharimonadales bacterium]
MIGTAYGIAQATTVGGIGDLRPGQGGTADQNWTQTSLKVQRERRSRDLDEGTRDKGYGAGWSEQEL